MKKWILFVISFIVFIIFSLRVSTGIPLGFDLNIYNFVSSFRCDFLTKFFRLITFFGSEYAILIIVFLFLFFKNKKWFLSLFVDAGLVVTLNYLLKHIFTRERPLDLMIINEKGYSYPSGHSMIAVGFYGFIIYLIWQMNISKRLKYVLTGLLSILIILIGLSRIYFGVHYASDVIGGFSISLCLLIVYTSCIRKMIV